MSTKTLYEFLGIEPEATQEEIKAAAQYLVKKFHPSKFPGNQRVVARVKKIKQVYNILGNPQKRAAYDAALAKKMAEMAPPPSPKDQKRSLIGRQTVAKKQAQAAAPKAKPLRKQPVKAAPKPSRQLKKTPQKTLAIDEEKITKNQPVTEQKASRPQSHGLNYFLSLFFISLSTYFLFIEPANLRKIVTQVDFLQGKLWCINIGLQAILGLSLLMLLYTVFRQLTQRKKASRDKPNEANLKTSPTSTPAVVQKRAEATASKASHNQGLDQKRSEATASKASATMPQKTQEAKVSKPSATTTHQTPDTEPAEKIVQGTHIHWLKHIIALLLILVPVYLAFFTKLSQFLEQSEFWQDKIMYVNWTLQGLFLAGCLIWLHTVFLHIIRLFRKIFHRDKKQNDETPVIKKNKPQDNKGIKHETPLKKNSTERQAGKKPVSRRYGLAYLIALLLMAMPTYLLFIDPKLLKRIVFQFDFLQDRLDRLDRLFYINLSLQALLVLSVLILLITLFQHWKTILKRKALKKIEAAAKMSAVKEQSAENKTLAKTSVKQAAKPQQRPAANRPKQAADKGATRTAASGKQAAAQKRPPANQPKQANEGLTRTASTPSATARPQQRPPANRQRPETANQTTGTLSKQAMEPLQQRNKAASLEKKTTVAERQKSAKPTASKRQTTIPPQKTQNSAKAQTVEAIKNKKANTLATPSQPEEAKMLAEKILYRADIHGIGAFKALLFIGIPIYLLLYPAFLEQYLNQVDFLREQLQYVNISLLVMVGVGVLMLLHALRHQFTTTLMITSQRIVARFGLLSRKQVDMTHEQFEQINVKQGLLGYILGFGTVKIRGLKGKSVGGLKINISHVASPKQFEKRLMRIIKNSAYHQI